MARTNLVVPAGFVPLNATAADIIRVPVASAQTNAIYPGEPVQAVSDGTVIRTPAGTSTSAAVDGITGVCTDIIQYKDTAGFLRRNAKYLPASTSWTAQGDVSIIAIIPSYLPIRYRVRASALVADIATGRSLTFENADHEYGTADTGLGLTGCRLKVSTHATTNSLQWRIVEVIDMVQNDVTQANFIVDVMVNLSYGWPLLGQSLTGV